MRKVKQIRDHLMLRIPVKLQNILYHVFLVLVESAEINHLRETVRSIQIFLA